MIQAAGIIGIGLATTGLIGAVIGTAFFFVTLAVAAVSLSHKDTFRLSDRLRSLWSYITIHSYACCNIGIIITVFLFITYIKEPTYALQGFPTPQTTEVVGGIPTFSSIHDFLTPNLVELFRGSVSETIQHLHSRGIYDVSMNDVSLRYMFNFPISRSDLHDIVYNHWNTYYDDWPYHDIRSRILTSSNGQGGFVSSRLHNFIFFEPND